MTKLSGSLPSGDGNGLTEVTSAMLNDPGRLHVAIAIVDCSKITTNTDTGEVTPTARIRRIEVVTDEDRKVAEGLMRRALDQRTGREALPYDLEQELKGVFEDMSVEDDDEHQEDLP